MGPCHGREPLRDRGGTASKSLFASHGGSIAGVNAWTNGCMSVEDRSCFSYQVAAGQHDVGQQRRRRHPEVGRDQQVELALGGLVVPGDLGGPRRLGVLVPSTLEWVPSRCLRKYSLPFAERADQVRAPQHQRARPVLGGVDVVDRGLEADRPAARPRRTTAGSAAAPVVDGGAAPRRRRRAGCGRTAGRTASSRAARTARSRRRCACRPGAPRPAARRASRRSSRRCATGRCACTSTTCRSSCAAAGSSRGRWRARSSR